MTRKVNLLPALRRSITEAMNPSNGWQWPEIACPQCTAFFARFQCSGTSYGECDCPRCQGYCTCGEFPSESDR